MNVTTTIEGRERYPVNVRYARELRNDIETLKHILVPIPAGETQAPRHQLRLWAWEVLLRRRAQHRFPWVRWPT
jgi:Cu/Ag efflux pump CusA